MNYYFNLTFFKFTKIILKKKINHFYESRWNDIIGNKMMEEAMVIVLYSP